MEITQEAVLTLLIDKRGKMKNSDLLGKFKGSLNCADPVEKKRNRDLFKTFVNTVAVVKEIDDVKYIVLKKKYHYLMNTNENQGISVHKTDDEELNMHTSDLKDDITEEQTASLRVSREGLKENEQQLPTEVQSPTEKATHRKQKEHFKIKGVSDSNEDKSPREALSVDKSPFLIASNKPYALPLRLPSTGTRIEIQKLKGFVDEHQSRSDTDINRSCSNKSGPSEESMALSSPLSRRAVKSTKPFEEPKESRFSSTVPLEQSEHELLVKSASGLWSQVYGLLLRDTHLAGKKDFMSGFTALHWAAKSGNTEMVCKIIEISRQGGIDIDINTKTHGGYTPLHIAALHNQELILQMLLDDYGADANIRDNCGKKAYHYVHSGVSGRVRELLGEPQVQQAQESTQHEKEEPDLSKGLHTISRLFQPHMTGHKKKHKQRPGFYSLSDVPVEEREDAELRNRVGSDIFM